MEKEALLAIIINDLKEVDILMNTFNKPGAIDQDFLQLAMTKINHITNEMKMLEKYSNASAHTTAQIVIQTTEKQQVEAPDKIFPEKQEPVIEIKEEVKEIKSAEKNYFTLDSIEEVKVELTKNDNLNHPVATPAAEVVEMTLTDAPKLIIEEIKTPESKMQSMIEKEEEIISITPKIDERIKEEPKKEESHTLKDAIAQNKKSVNDVISEKKVLPQPLGANIVVPVANIYKAIGINDKLLFQRELFSGKGDLMNQVIDQLNEMKSFEEAHSFLSTAFEWNFENERVISFLNIVKRRYL